MKSYVTIPSIAALLFLTGNPSVTAQESDEIRYGECLDLAERFPDQAINKALIWKSEAGGVPARHCEAVGLFFLREYSEAAIRLQSIAEDMRIGKDMPIRNDRRIVANEAMLADMYGQAANAWLLANEIVRAESAINTALSLAEEKTGQWADLTVDKARVAAADEDFTLALSLVEAGLAVDVGRKDILILAASPARALKEYSKAQYYLDDFQHVFPKNPTGHLERGNLEDALGHGILARKSWIKVLELTPEGINADAARANIERLDSNIK